MSLSNIGGNECAGIGVRFSTVYGACRRRSYGNGVISEGCSRLPFQRQGDILIIIRSHIVNGEFIEILTVFVDIISDNVVFFNANLVNIEQLRIGAAKIPLYAVIAFYDLVAIETERMSNLFLCSGGSTAVGRSFCYLGAVINEVYSTLLFGNGRNGYCYVLSAGYVKRLAGNCAERSGRNNGCGLTFICFLVFVTVFCGKEVGITVAVTDCKCVTVKCGALYAFVIKNGNIGNNGFG